MKLIFFNTSLYNTSSLENKLDLKDLQCSEHQLFQHAYQTWGSDLFSHLDGDYAFAFYDNDQKSYFAARDPLGIKALYYTKTEECYHFSSTVSDLLKLPDILKKPNLASMRTMLYDREVDYSETLYEGIYRLPPGYFMKIKDGKEQLERYWYPEKIQKDFDITEKEAVKKLHELYVKAVNKRISNINETAFQVSGGLDSSSSVCLLSKTVIPSKIDSYSMDFEGLKCDEGEYVDAILNQYPLNHEKIECAHLDYNKKFALHKVYEISADWPIMWVSVILLPIIETIRKDKKSVVLTGLGGDELFGGNAYVFYDLFKRFKFLKLYRELKDVSSPWKTIRNHIFKPMLGEKVIDLIKTVLKKKERRSFSMKNGKIKDLSQLAGVTDFSQMDDIDAIMSAQHSTVTDGNFTHPMEAYFNVEFRHPFYDLALVEFSLSLPPEFKFSQGKSKWILRKAMEGILPEKINKRKDKAEFSEILVQQIDALDLSSLLDESYMVTLGLIKQTEVDRVRKEYAEEEVKKPFFIWGMINMEYWYRYNFEKESLNIDA